MYIRTSDGLGQVAPAIAKQPANATLAQFEKHSAKLKNCHAPKIDRVADKIAASWKIGQPIYTVYVKGYTSSEGLPQYNIGLGHRRALAVRRALQLALERKQKNLSYKVLVLTLSRGAKDPIATNETEYGRCQNRRVEIFLSTKKLLPKKPSLPDYPPSPDHQSCDEGRLQRLFEKCDETFNDCNKFAREMFLKRTLDCGSDRECRNQAYRIAQNERSWCISDLRLCKEQAGYATKCK